MFGKTLKEDLMNNTLEPLAETEKSYSFYN